MTRTRSPSGGARGGTIAQPIDHSVRLWHLSWMLFFFLAPLTVNTLHGRDLPCHPIQKVKATCHPYLAVLWYLETYVCQSSRRAQKNPPLQPLSLRCRFKLPMSVPRPLPSSSSYGSCPSALPPLWSLCLWSLPCPAQHASRASTQTTMKCRIIIEGAFLFQEVTAAVVVPASRGAHFKHATPHPHRRQGYARLHARPRLPVGPRIAIPACGLACRTLHQGKEGRRPGTVQQNV